MQALREHDHWNSPIDRSPEAEGKKVGRGVAGGFWFNGTGPASAIVSVLADGTVSLVEGSPDIGGTRAVAAMHVAEVLGIAAEDVAPAVGDTNSIGWTSMTGGSGVAFKTGWASYEAAQDVKQQMINRAARIWDIDPENVEFDNGVIQHKSERNCGSPSGNWRPGSTAPAAPSSGGPTCRPPASAEPTRCTSPTWRWTRKPARWTSCATPPSRTPAPPSTLLRGGADPGRRRPGHRLGAERRVLLQQRRPVADSSFLDYRMPTALDLPMIDTVVVEVPNPGHPLRRARRRRSSHRPAMAAIANAIHDATGVRMQNLPMNPGAVLKRCGSRTTDSPITRQPLERRGV